MLSSRLLRNPPLETQSDGEFVGRWLSAASRREVLERLSGAAKSEAEAMLAHARVEAAALQLSACAEAEAIRATAHATGFATGRADGMQAAESIAASLKAAAAHAAEITAEALLAAEAQLVELALAIAAHVVGESLARDHQAIAVAAAGEALRTAASAPLRIRVAPSDLDSVRAAIEGDEGAPLVVGEDGIGIGGCVLHLQDGSVDLRVETRLRSVGSMLRGEG